MEFVIRDGVLYEAVLSTLLDDSIYLAPIGFTKSGNRIYTKIYKGGLLEKAVLKAHRIALNITYSPTIYTYTSLKAEFNGLNKLRELVIYDEKHGLPLLSNSIGYIVLERSQIVDQGEYYSIEYEIIDKWLNKEVVLEPYTRCYTAIIEILVYATKIKALKDRADEKTLNKYRNIIEYNIEVTRKTCSLHELLLVEQIQSWVEKWLEEK